MRKVVQYSWWWTVSLLRSLGRWVVAIRQTRDGAGPIDCDRCHGSLADRSMLEALINRDDVSQSSSNGCKETACPGDVSPLLASVRTRGDALDRVTYGAQQGPMLG